MNIETQETCLNFLNNCEYCEDFATTDKTLPVKKLSISCISSAAYVRNIDYFFKIKDIEIIVPNKVVKVIYSDNTFEKVVCDEKDPFSLDAAIAICALKRVFRLCSNSKNGGNKYLNDARKLLENKEKEKQKNIDEQKRIEEKRKKRATKCKARKERRAKEEREKQIDILTEAIIRAKEKLNK